MSNNPIQSRVADWISSSNPHPITLTWTRTSSNHPIATITQTDYVTSTIIASDSTTPSTLSDIEYDAYVENLWEHRIHHFLPMILAFAVIGVLTVLGSLVYLAYRFYQTNRVSRQRRRQKAEQKREEEGSASEKPTSPRSTTLSHIIPWLGIQSPNESYYHPQQREPIRFEKSDLRRIIDDTPSTRRPSLATSWLAKLLPTRRHMSLPILLSSSSGSSSPMDNLNIPISSTFVPIQTSSLTLVPRSEIWQDPHRRRGVDEVDMWERKQSGTEILTIAVPEEEEEEAVQVHSPSTPQQPMWKFTQRHEAYPDSPDSFHDRRFSLPSRRSMEEQQLASHRSSTTTMLNNMPFPSTSSENKLGYNGSKSTHVGKERQNDQVIASTSTHYPNAFNCCEEVDGNGSDPYFSKFTITVKLPNRKTTQTSPASANDVALARQELEASRLNNSSSQWLHSSSSKSF